MKSVLKRIVIATSLGTGTLCARETPALLQKAVENYEALAGSLEVEGIVRAVNGRNMLESARKETSSPLNVIIENYSIYFHEWKQGDDYRSTCTMYTNVSKDGLTSSSGATELLVSNGQYFTNCYKKDRYVQWKFGKVDGSPFRMHTPDALMLLASPDMSAKTPKQKLAEYDEPAIFFWRRRPALTWEEVPSGTELYTTGSAVVSHAMPIEQLEFVVDSGPVARLKSFRRLQRSPTGSMLPINSYTFQYTASDSALPSRVIAKRYTGGTAGRPLEVDSYTEVQVHRIRKLPATGIPPSTRALLSRIPPSAHVHDFRTNKGVTASDLQVEFN